MTTEIATHDLTLDDFVAAKDLPNAYPKLFRSKFQIDWLIRHRETNGLEASGALVRFGKEWMFVLPRFVVYLASRTPAKAA